MASKKKSEDFRKLQKLLRARAVEEKIRHKNKLKEEAAAKLAQAESDSSGLASVTTALKKFLDSQSTFIDLVHELQRLLPKNENEEEKLNQDEAMIMYLTGKRYGDVFDAVFGMTPPSIALVTLHDFFKESERFNIVDPNSLPDAEKYAEPYPLPSTTHTTVEIGKETLSVPMQGEFWFTDTKHNCKFVVSYKPSQSGAIAVSIYSDYDNDEATVELVQELKNSVLSSPYIKGKVIEITDGNDFRVVEIGPQPEPIIDPKLKAELEKNVVNIFTKRDQFQKYNLPVKGSVILCGPPGCGKTMIERWLASKVSGDVTTIWVTAKSIQSATDVANVFDIARKLSPALVVMEDLDLISGTRHQLLGQSGSGPLGEMLNQLDGLTQDQSIVLVGSTNRLGHLDEALADRPGRFDRVYVVKQPSSDIAKTIARNYLLKRGVTQEIVDNLMLTPFNGDEFTGAQIVEIVKGGIKEAIHRNSEVSDACIASSARGLQEQRELYKRQQQS